MSLKELQREFLNYIYKDEALTNTAKDIISPSLRESMAIYRRHVWYTLIATLESHYVSVKQILGKEVFSNIAEQYITKTPSKTPDLECYGLDFPDFLKTQKIESYLYDLSQLDLAYVKAAISQNYNSTTIEEFKNINPEDFERVTFVENPTNIICKLSYDIFDIFTDIKLDNNTKIVAPEKKESLIIVSRDKKNNISHQKISKGDALFLSLCRQGETFYSIYDKTEKAYKDFCFQTSLTKLIQNQYIIGFTIN